MLYNKTIIGQIEIPQLPVSARTGRFVISRRPTAGFLFGETV